MEKNNLEKSLFNGDALLRDRPVSEIFGVLHRVLGNRIVAYTLKKDGQYELMERYRASEDVPDEASQVILYDLADTMEALYVRESSEDEARKILMRNNHILHEHSPMELIRDGESQRIASLAKLGLLTTEE